MSSLTHGVERVPAKHLLLVAILTLVWGFNWPVLKLGVNAMAPLTFRACTLIFAAMGMLLVSRLSGDSIAVPRAWWGRVTALAVLNIGAWNGLVLFGLQHMPAGRSSILAYTMPLWSVLFSMFLLDEPLSRRKLIGLGLGMIGMVVLLGEDFENFQRSPTGALLILGAAVCWAFGTVLLRRWKPQVPQNTLSGWMMLIGWLPLAVCAPFFDPHPIESLIHLSASGWFAVLYNIFLAGTLAHWAWFRMARTVPIAISSMSSLPVPVVGVISGMVLLGERPGISEFIALALVLASLAAVLLPERRETAVTPVQE